MNRNIHRKNRNRIWLDLLAIVILFFILVLVGLSLSNYVKYRLLDFAEASKGSIEEKIPAQMIVFREEYLVTAPVAGEYETTVVNGERVKSGSVIGYIKGTALYAPKGGIVTQDLDGWETILVKDKLTELDIPHVLGILADEALAASAGSAQSKDIADSDADRHNLAAGRPLAKIIDNLVDYQVFLLLQGNFFELAEADKLAISMAGDVNFSAKVLESGLIEENSYFIASVSSREDALLYLRYANIDVITHKVGGLIIPASAVFVDDEGRQGVYYKYKRSLAFTEVEVLYSGDMDGKEVVIIEGISEGAQVVVNPDKARLGQRIYY